MGSPDPPWPPVSPGPPCLPEYPCFAVGPGASAALEATCPVSVSLEASSAPAPPIGCCTAQVVSVRSGGGGGNVRHVSLYLVSPFLLCPYMVLTVLVLSLLFQLIPALCLDYVLGVSSKFSLFIVCSAPCFLSVIIRQTVNVICVCLPPPVQ